VPEVPPLSFLHPYLRLAYIELHHVNGLDHIVVVEREIKILQGFLLVSVPQDGIGNVRIDPAPHGVREPAVPEVEDRRFAIEARVLDRRYLASCQGNPREGCCAPGSGKPGPGRTTGAFLVVPSRPPNSMRSTIESCTIFICLEYS
jgi:hypothetical protein